MSVNYEFGRGEGNFYLWDYVTGKEVATFDTEEVTVATALCIEYMSNKLPNEKVIDDRYPAIITFKKGVPVSFDAQLSEWESDLKAEWLGIKSDEFEEPECSHCGDGGCIHCQPSLFI